MDNIFGNIEEVKEPVVETATKEPIDDINAILSGYKNVTPEIKNDEPVTNNQQIHENSTSSVAQPMAQQSTQNGSVFNNVYKSGKKAGQPRKPRVTVTPTQQQATLSGEILTGALFITLVDLVLPMIIAGLNNRFSKQKIKASDLYLSAKQKNELAPIADKVVKQFDFNANPNALLVISMIGIYGANFALLKFGGNKDEKNTDSTAKKTN